MDEESLKDNLASCESLGRESPRLYVETPLLDLKRGSREPESKDRNLYPLLGSDVPIEGATVNPAYNDTALER
jgi:hypothetical protein